MKVQVILEPGPPYFGGSHHERSKGRDAPLQKSANSLNASWSSP